MIKLQEKRHSIRHTCECPLTLLFTQRRSRPIEAWLIDFSACGLSFESHHALKPGTTLIVQVSGESYRHMPAETECQLPSMGLAMIKWCRAGCRQGRPIQKMGAAYLMPY